MLCVAVMLSDTKDHVVAYCSKPLMPVAVLTLELRIEHSRSLKDRRQVVRSLKDQLAHRFNISVAELDEAVTWQSATFGIAAISASRDYLTGQMQAIEAAAIPMTHELGAEITDVWWEFLESDPASSLQQS